MFSMNNLERRSGACDGDSEAGTCSGEEANRRSPADAWLETAGTRSLDAETPKFGEESKVGPSLEAMERETSNLGEGSSWDTRAHVYQGRLGLGNHMTHSSEQGQKVKITLRLQAPN